MKISDIDLRLLRVFQTVAEYGGIVKAQAPLGINQPTISSHIANLERRLNLVLCHRGPKGFSLTPAGEMVLEETKRLNTHLNDYALKLSSISESSERRIRLGLIDSLVTHPKCFVHQSLKDINESIGPLDVILGVFDYLDIISELRGDRIDIGIVGLGNKVPLGLKSHFLYNEVSHLFCSIEHPCALENDPIAKEQILKSTKISNQSFENNLFEGQWSELSLSGNTSSSGHIEATAHLVLAQTHVGLLPVHYAQPWVNAGLICSVLPETYNVSSQIHLAYLEGKQQNDATLAFIEKLCSMAADE